MNFKGVANNSKAWVISISNPRWIEGMMKQQIILFNKCIVLLKEIIIFTESQFCSDELLFKSLFPYDIFGKQLTNNCLANFYVCIYKSLLLLNFTPSKLICFDCVRAFPIFFIWIFQNSIIFPTMKVKHNMKKMTRLEGITRVIPDVLLNQKH